jgi:PAS domain S-box-containing protein
MVAPFSIFAATYVRLLLDSTLGDRFPFATVFFAVLLTAWFGGLGPALLASILGALTSAWYLLAPRYSFAIASTEDQAGLVLYLALSAGFALLGGGMQRARRQAEANAAAVGKHREELRVTLESIGDAVLTTDTGGHITSMNAVAVALTGWSTADAIGRPLEDVFKIIDEETKRPAVNPVDKVLAEGQVAGLANHTALIARDGTVRPIDDSAAPIRDADEALIGTVLVFRDVTARRRIEDQLRRSERELTDLFENANVGVHFVGPDGIIMHVNKTELDMLGYRREEYVGHHIAEFHTDQEVIADALRRLAAGEILSGYGAQMRCKDGSTKDVSINSSVRWEEGRFIHTRSFTLDVTEQRHAHEARALLAAVVESSDDAIITKTLDGTITSWNAGAERLFGYHADEAIGRPITIIIPPERRSEEREIIARLQRGERIDHFETVRVRKNGSMIDISLTISPVRDSSDRIVGASKIARDITQSKRAQEALVAADRRKELFLATLAHELRNPLAALRNSVEVLRHSDGDPGLLGKVHETMNRQLSHLERLVDDLVDISRISRDQLELRREKVELASVVHHALETCRPLAESRDLALSVELGREPIFLDADPVRLAQVISNLINNACKYTEPHGHIWINAKREGEQAVITVRDTGLGIPTDMLSSIFDMFSQVSRSPEHAPTGLGIGLTLVRRLVEMHGGTIEASSDGPGRGSEFVVRLPALASPVEQAPAPATTNESLGRRLRILVVDDNADAAESLAMLLQMTGHETYLAHDGVEALALAEQMRPQVVLLDIGLPKMSGHDVAQRIRSEPWGQEIVLVALTGWGQQQDRRRSQEAGFDHHLVKPVDVDTLMRVLSTAHAR